MPTDPSRVVDSKAMMPLQSIPPDRQKTKVALEPSTSQLSRSPRKANLTSLRQVKNRPTSTVPSSLRSPSDLISFGPLQSTAKPTQVTSRSSSCTIFEDVECFPLPESHLNDNSVEGKTQVERARHSLRTTCALPLTQRPTLHTLDSQPLTPRLRRSPAEPDLSNPQQPRKPPTPAEQPSRRLPSRLTSSNPLHLKGISSGSPTSPILFTIDYLQQPLSRKQTVGRLPSKGPLSYHFNDERKRTINAQPSRKISLTPPSSSSQAHCINTSSEIRPLNRKIIDQERLETHRKGRLQAQDWDIKPSIQQQSKAAKETSPTQANIRISKTFDSRRLQQSSKENKKQNIARHQIHDKILSRDNDSNKTHSIHIFYLDDDPKMSCLFSCAPFLRCQSLGSSNYPFFNRRGHEAFTFPTGTTSFASESTGPISPVQGRQVPRTLDGKQNSYRRKSTSTTYLLLQTRRLPHIM